MDTESMISSLKAARTALKKNFRSEGMKRLDLATIAIRKLGGAEASETSMSVSTPVSTPALKRRRKLSRERHGSRSRKAQKARWAKQKSAKGK